MKQERKNIFKTLWKLVGDAIQNKKEFIRNSFVARQGNVIAQRKLGAAYLFGKGTSKNLKNAERWLRLASEHGDSSAKSLLVVAQRELGVAYMFGTHGSMDFEKAEKWLRLAAEQGDYGAKSFLEDLERLFKPLLTKATRRQGKPLPVKARGQEKGAVHGLVLFEDDRTDPKI